MRYTLESDKVISRNIAKAPARTSPNAIITSTHTNSFDSNVSSIESVMAELAFRRNHRIAEWEDYNKGEQCWKNDAWFVYEKIAEIKKAVDLISQTLSRGKLRIAVQDEDGCFTVPSSNDDTTIESESYKKAQEVLRDFSGPGGCGIMDLLESAATNFQVIGEGFLLGRAYYDYPGEPLSQFKENQNSGRKVKGYHAWEVLSPDEIQIEKTGQSIVAKRIFQPGSQMMPQYSQRIRKNNLSNEEILDIGDDDDSEDAPHYLQRITTPSRRFSRSSTSPIQGIILEGLQYLDLKQLTDSIIHSKMNSGMLLLPQGLEFQDGRPFNPDDMDEDNPYPASISEVIARHFTMPNEALSNPSGPLVLVSSAEELKGVRFLSLSRDLDLVMDRQRNQIRESIIMGLYIPREVIEGKKSLNHWTGFNVSNDMVTDYILPLANKICKELTVAFLRPMLQYCGMDQKEALKYWISYDASTLYGKPDKGEYAFRLWEGGFPITEQAVAEALGFETTSLENRAQRKERLLMKMIGQSPVTLAPLLIPLIPEFADIAEEIRAIRDCNTDDTQLTSRSGNDRTLRDGQVTEVIEDLRGKTRTARSADPTRRRSATTPPTQARGSETARGANTSVKPSLSQDDSVDISAYQPLISKLNSLADETLQLSYIYAKQHFLNDMRIEQAKGNFQDIDLSQPDIMSSLSQQDLVQLEAVGIDLDAYIANSQYIDDFTGDANKAVIDFLRDELQLTDEEISPLSNGIPEVVVNLRVIVEEVMKNQIQAHITLGSELLVDRQFIEAPFEVFEIQRLQKLN